MYLYVITNRMNGKQYVGIAVQPFRRWREHRSGHGSRVVWSAIQKYGLGCFDFAVLCRGSADYMRDLEQKVIERFQTMAPKGYNLTLGGEGTQGWKWSEEVREKMRGRRNGMQGRSHTEETRQLLRKKAMGRKWSDEVRRKLTLLRGAEHWNAKPVTLNGVEYASIQGAAFSLKRSVGYIRKLMRAGITTCSVFDCHQHAKEIGLRNRGRRPSDEVCRLMSVGKTGDRHPKAKRVVVYGVEYGCLKDAAKAIGRNYSTLRWQFQTWQRKGTFPEGCAVLSG